MQIVDLGEIDRQQRAAQEIRLLLVVALQANPVARPDHGLQQARHVVRFDDLAAGKASSRRNARIARGSIVLPARHDRHSLRPAPHRSISASSIAFVNLGTVGTAGGL
ncbi:hypothetical protein ACVWW4_001074 [Bradyrhizobium sp. LB7.1]